MNRWFQRLTFIGLLVDVILSSVQISSSHAVAQGAVFSYTTPTFSVQYTFTPQTGTLHDLSVNYNNQFTFLPANFGGINEFMLAGEVLRPWEQRHTSQLISEEQQGSVYTAHFRWSFNNDSLDFSLQLSMQNQRLVVELDSPSTKITRFGFDRSAQTPDPKVIELPYGHNVMFTNGIFVSALFDKTVSHASRIFPQHTLASSTSMYFGETGSYLQRTDGQRNSLHERMYLTVSPNIEDTFYRGDNPVSPYRQQLNNKVVVDLWRNFAQYDQDLRTLAASGMTDLFVIMHFWQNQGYDNGLPSTYPAGDMYGGDAQLKNVMEFCRSQQYLYALHTNYVDFYPNSSVWNPQNLALDSSGAWIPAWYNQSTGIQSYLIKPSQALTYAQQYEPLIHQNYHTNAVFLDVHSAVYPAQMVDFDATVANAGQQSATYQQYQTLLNYARTVHNGPIVGEGFGASTSLWAGYVDGIEADPRSAAAATSGGGSAIPIIVDYKLLQLHDLFVPHGAGYLERFFWTKYNGFTSDDLARYRATELAFGNAGFLSNPFARPIPLVEIKREYCLMKPIQQRYLSSTPTSIKYSVNDQFINLSDALRLVLPTTTDANVNATLSEELGIVQIHYANNFTLTVNRSQQRSITLDNNGQTLTLRPNNFLAIQPQQFLAYSAEVQGTSKTYVSNYEPTCKDVLSVTTNYAPFVAVQTN